MSSCTIGQTDRNALNRPLFRKILFLTIGNTDFRSQEMFDLIDTIYRNAQHLTLTSNFALKELVELEKLRPSLVRRIDEICKVLEV